MIDGSCDIHIAIANWISVGGHTRPFWRDADFVAEFGRVARADLRAAVDELKRRASAKAEAAGLPISWTATIQKRDGLERNISCQ